ncbi:MAG: hypothetical protein WCG27_11735, partial [Pseudomonadota bacterium]
MKKLLLLVGLIVLSTSVYASKARMQALQQDPNTGSNFINDTRNVFGNPAGLNTMKNYLITEWGAPINTVGTVAAPRAEGGFFKEVGPVVAGAYMGSLINTFNAERVGGKT